MLFALWSAAGAQEAGDAVVAGPMGPETSISKTPAHHRLKTEMARFLKWFHAGGRQLERGIKIRAARLFGL